MGRILGIMLVATAQLLTIVSLIVSGILIYPGRIDKQEVDRRYLALIDTSEVTTNVGTITYHGLPDSHDFSRHKDFFALYVGTYCSGRKEGSNYKLDFCSKFGQELFDQYRVWKVWGVDLGDSTNSKDKVQKSIGVEAIKTIPRTIFIWFNILLGLQVISMVTGFVGICNYWAKMLTSIFAILASISGLAVASLSQSLYPTLVNRTHNYQVSNSKLTAKLGSGVLFSLWTIAIFNIASAVLWCITARKTKPKHPSSKKVASSSSPFDDIPGIVRRATGGLLGKQDSSYEKIRAEAHSTLLRSSRAPSTDNIPLSSRDSSRLHAHEFREESDHEEDVKRDGQKYEALRHRKSSE